MSAWLVYVYMTTKRISHVPETSDNALPTHPSMKLKVELSPPHREIAPTVRLVRYRLEKLARLANLDVRDLGMLESEGRQAFQLRL